MNIKPQDKASLVLLNCGFNWGTVTDKKITEEVVADNKAAKGSLRVRKTLLPEDAGKYVKALQTVTGEFYQYHLSRTYGTGVDGQRVMPTQFYFDYMEKFGAAQAKANDALDDLINNYDSAIERAKDLLADSFKREDYPEAEEIKRYLHLKVRFLPVPAGDQIMNALGASVAADVDEYVAGIMKTAAEDAKDRLRKAVERMAERLTADGGRIYDTMPQAINDLAEQLPVIAGIADDKELAAMVKEVKQTLGGYSGDDFRNNEALKSDVGKAAMELLKRMPK